MLPDRKEEFRASTDKAIAYATRMGAPQLNCLAGIAPAGADPGQLKETFVENLTFPDGQLNAEGIKLLIEPINTRDMPGSYLNHTKQAAGIIAETGSDNLFIQYDVYRMQIMEGDLAPTIEAYLDRIPHIQISDTPGRHEPGTGEINVPSCSAIWAGWVTGDGSVANTGRRAGPRRALAGSSPASDQFVWKQETQRETALPRADTQPARL